MLFTSLAAIVAVSGLASANTPAASPKWQPDYSTAVKAAAAQHKPLAVVVGHGPAGFAQVVPVAPLASDQFVSVYVDADSPAGKPLAQALKVTDGLVISDHTGTLVALRHQGPVAPAALTTYLATYAVERPVVQTMQAGTLAPAAAPVYAPAPSYAPAMGGRFMGGFGGGCPGGNCGGGRMFR